MSPTYLELEQALQNAAFQVETMSSIIAYLLPGAGRQVTISADNLRTFHDSFSVIVTPHDDSITIELKEKDDK